MHENRNWKLENRNWIKLETTSKLEDLETIRTSVELEIALSTGFEFLDAFQFPVSNFQFRIAFVCPFLLSLILAANACNWFNPQPMGESDRHELALRFVNVVTNAGGPRFGSNIPPGCTAGKVPNSPCKCSPRPRLIVP